ncbi:MAG: hypothetical protein A3G52_03740 [Candidatus Taylorbacteria bacterium RIFCSPLOWO2_12_FULL_43_20]|uniref:Uncharacterized protein n=1 Tax=Candidatus Taylorbacteria bacterium RIFCSPLOWO2_12_FULL_43_20 TaxID=1802332 RepID=A0A1G2P1T1_9BACT|nr:MAG: hypothetical protein A3E92_02310 [Candidatus Taylorbacteria bacterium RIFCSPHIGHO2_12_FULL_42_34]OHA31726.1 MAG: hypothetical protein A3B09_01755 [Candidatus Taylorbacteria bacterium RIFCSPLOWO2_01_FULL_43_83]OHA38777.1 MAG: hypothetical protein A3H58_01865 [Candidatus Taylorbacteria bacterium RIFCSPLOWO2_02_FULL_43_22b]OHA42280.1 MAG: hypothetical protein A3G52_03740 [Candidatus Taylorbacteria bacterium RIFCSPLOWO2_12_FULL_43_20]
MYIIVGFSSLFLIIAGVLGMIFCTRGKMPFFIAIMFGLVGVLVLAPSLVPESSKLITMRPAGSPTTLASLDTETVFKVIGTGEIEKDGGGGLAVLIDAVKHIPSGPVLVLIGTNEVSRGMYVTVEGDALVPFPPPPPPDTVALTATNALE